MAEYIDKEATINALDSRDEYDDLVNTIRKQPAADVQEKRYCKMIPLEPDSRGYTNVFICTNCHQYIYLGFIQKEYSGSYCSACGAEVERGIKIPKRDKPLYTMDEICKMNTRRRLPDNFVL